MGLLSTLFWTFGVRKSFAIIKPTDLDRRMSSAVACRSKTPLDS